MFRIFGILCSLFVAWLLTFTGFDEAVIKMINDFTGWHIGLFGYYIASIFVGIVDLALLLFISND